MKMDTLSFVGFDKHGERYIAFIEMEDALSSQADLEGLLHNAANLYEHAINDMQLLMADILDIRSDHKPVPARKIWRLGDIIFTLRDNLAGMHLQLDNLYGHLCRDLSSKRKWLEKVIIFRRYIPYETLIPESLSWWRCEKGTRQVAEMLTKQREADPND